MYNFTVRNVNHALPLGLAMLRDRGMRISPRGMDTLELPGSVATIYERPREMVLFDPVRDANPFFHFFEALWILQGREDVEFLAHFNSKMRDYSDNGNTFHAPYGHRMRRLMVARHDPTWIDQIEKCVEKLRSDPDSRQCVISIWDAGRDWERTKDVPCNDMIMFKVRDMKLRMLVCNRSNDVIWGAYGANVVQFSTLLAYVAGRIGVGVGEYTQLSDSYHVYENSNSVYWQQWLEKHPGGVPSVDDPYEYDEELVGQHSRWMQPHDMMTGNFDVDLGTFFQAFDLGHTDEHTYYTESFTKVVQPMWETHAAWKAKEPLKAMAHCSRIEAPDWRKACREWMKRRMNK